MSPFHPSATYDTSISAGIQMERAEVVMAIAKLKKKHGIFDYWDNLMTAVQVLEQSALAKSELLSRFNSLVIDDVQGMTPIQLKILALMSGHQRSRHGNSSGVGNESMPVLATVDPYIVSKRYVGGRTHAEEFVHQFQGTVTEVLTQSHRCSAKVARAALGLRPKLQPKSRARSQIAQKLAGVDLSCSHAAEESEESGSVQWRPFKNETQELMALARDIRETITTGGVAPGDVAVMVPSWKNLERTSAALAEAGLAVHCPYQRSRLFDNGAVRLAMSFMRSVLHPSESSPLLHLLTQCPAYRLPPAELSTLLEGQLARHVPLREYLTSAATGVSALGGSVSDAAAAVASSLLKDLEKLAAAAAHKGSREVLSDFLDVAGLLPGLLQPSSLEEQADASAVAALFQLLVIAEQHAEGDALRQVEPVVRLFRRHGSTYDFRWPESESPRECDELENSPGNFTGDPEKLFGFDGPLGRPDMVSLIPLPSVQDVKQTFHTVFMPRLTNQLLPGRRPPLRHRLPPTCLGEPLPTTSAARRSGNRREMLWHQDKTRSMLYAGITRARVAAVLSSAGATIRGSRSLHPTPFLDEALGGKLAEKVLLGPERAGADNLQGSSAASPATVVAAAAKEQEQEEEVSDHVRLSYSSVYSYRACPYGYYLAHVLKVSPAPSPLMVYGKALHEAAAAVQNGQAVDPAAAQERFLSSFQGCSFESVRQREEMEERGMQAAAAFAERYLSEGRSGESPYVEHRFAVPLEVDGGGSIMLSGVFDRIHRDASGGLCVTDFKTNVRKKSVEKMAQDNLQLSMYSLAAELVFGEAPSLVAIESIEDGRRAQVAPTADEREQTVQLIKSTACQVRQGLFDPQPSYQTCSNCGFRNICAHSAQTASV
ncbi:unnamed protein product [Chrysoparadoxa australica]